jgi:hypothetical protein
VPGELDRDLLGRDAPRTMSSAEHEAGTAADQRGEDDVGVSDDDGRQRNRRAPLAR